MFLNSVLRNSNWSGIWGMCPRTDLTVGTGWQEEGRSPSSPPEKQKTV
jgi:hypothetical protein